MMDTLELVQNEDEHIAVNIPGMTAPFLVA